MHAETVSECLEFSGGAAGRLDSSRAASGAGFLTCAAEVFGVFGGYA
mgnify:CR=1 FL=1